MAVAAATAELFAGHGVIYVTALHAAATEAGFPGAVVSVLGGEVFWSGS